MSLTCPLREEPGRHAVPAPATPGRLRRMLDMVAMWFYRSAERSQLAGLDDRALQDMGITRYDVMHEIRKPFWQG